MVFKVSIGKAPRLALGSINVLLYITTHSPLHPSRYNSFDCVSLVIKKLDSVIQLTMTLASQLILSRATSLTLFVSAFKLDWSKLEELACL